MPLSPSRIRLSGLPLVCAVVAAALLGTVGEARAGAGGRSACDLHPATGDVVSDAADGLTMVLDDAKPVALANWDVRWWRHHRVWITLVATDPGAAAAAVLPELVVDAHPGGGATEVLRGNPLALAAQAQASERLAIWIPDDARTLGLRVRRSEAGQRIAVTLSAECSDARFDAGVMPPPAAQLLDEALKLYFSDYVDPLPNPRVAFETVQALASGAQDGTDVAWAVRGLMQAVGDRNSFFVGPGEDARVAAPSTGSPRQPGVTPAITAPVTSAITLRPDGVAVLQLFELDFESPERALAWARSLHEGIAALAPRRPRGWLVDLRDCGGTDRLPALAGMSTLLDGPAVGASIGRRSHQDWIVERGAVRVAGGPATLDLQLPPEPSFSGPVAVLIGPGTANAGEALAVALEGRARTRFFGAPTAGFPNWGVHTHALADGSLLGILDRREADRTGRVYRTSLIPDPPTDGGVLFGDTAAEAIDWVLSEPPSEPAAR